MVRKCSADAVNAGNTGGREQYIRGSINIRNGAALSTDNVWILGGEIASVESTVARASDSNKS